MTKNSPGDVFNRALEIIREEEDDPNKVLEALADVLISIMEVKGKAEEHKDIMKRLYSAKAVVTSSHKSVKTMGHQLIVLLVCSWDMRELGI